MAMEKQRTRGRNIFKIVRPILVALTGIFTSCPSDWHLRHSSFWTHFWVDRSGIALCTHEKACWPRWRECLFGRGVEVKEWQNLRLGSNVSIHKDCYIDASGGLVIGSDVSIAHGSSILTFEHSWDDELIPIRSNPIRFSAVIIEDDVWIGCGCRILAGVTIRSRVVVAAGAVVTSEVASRSLVGGVPHKFIKRI